MLRLPSFHNARFLHQHQVDAERHIPTFAFQQVRFRSGYVDRCGSARPGEHPQIARCGVEIAADDETRRGDMLCDTIWPISLVEAFFHELFTTDSRPCIVSLWLSEDG